MIVDRRTHWPDVLREIGPSVFATVAVGVVLAVIDNRHHTFRAFAIPDLLLTVIGAALTILLGFRTNAAYARWWEARTLWGGLVNQSRTLARQAITFVPALAEPLVREQIAYIHALRCHLRKQDPFPEIAPFLDGAAQPPDGAQEPLREARNVPAALLLQMGRRVAAAADTGALDELRLQRLDATLTELTNLQGGCERIKNTPLPRQYDHFPELFVRVYCLLLPFALVEELGLYTPLVVFAIGFVFFTLNQIGKNLEDPFENRAYDTPMTALSRTIQIDLLQQLGERELPPALQPQEGVLL